MELSSLGRYQQETRQIKRIDDVARLCLTIDYDPTGLATWKLDLDNFTHCGSLRHSTMDRSITSTAPHIDVLTDTNTARRDYSDGNS